MSVAGGVAEPSARQHHDAERLKALVTEVDLDGLTAEHFAGHPGCGELPVLDQSAVRLDSLPDGIANLVDLPVASKLHPLPHPVEVTDANQVFAELFGFSPGDTGREVEFGSIDDEKFAMTRQGSPTEPRGRDDRGDCETTDDFPKSTRTLASGGGVGVVTDKATTPG